MELWTSPNWEDYQLLDSGGGKKLEQFGAIRLIRPEDQAVWRISLPTEEWQQAHAEFVPKGRGNSESWKYNQKIEPRWTMDYRDLKIAIEMANSVQVGLFPENASQWDWMRNELQRAKKDEPLQVLNLFGYTGLASIAAAAEHAVVTHVDSAKRAIRMGRDNQAINRFDDRVIRWVLEDVVKFVQREVKRGNKYDGVIMDPPAYGLGPKKERWVFEENFAQLCNLVREVLSDEPRFVVVTAYAINQPPEILLPPMREMLDGFGGELEVGELGLVEKSAGRKISYSISARWKA